MALKRTRQQGSGKSAAQKYADYAQVYADMVIQHLEDGTAPWIRPWGPGRSEPGFGAPYNAITGKCYSGSNYGWLLMIKEMKGYTDDRWLTFKQAMDLGCHVRKGEQSTVCIKWIVSDAKENDQGEDNEQARLFPILFSVFNGDQIEGMPLAPVREIPKEHERHEQCEALILAAGASISHNGGNRAYYSPASDSIHLPAREAFKSTDNYYATTLHELGHWTGHKSRLDRDLSGGFGSVSYAKEELVAELASMMIGDRLAIGHDPGQHVAYIASWIKLLQEHPREILIAASKAEQVCTHLGVAKYEHEPMKVAERSQMAEQVRGEREPSAVEAGKGRRASKRQRGVELSM